jgi:hypothetical protein
VRVGDASSDVVGLELGMVDADRFTRPGTVADYPRSMGVKMRAMTIEQLAIELLGLPAKVRAALAEKLIASLEDENAAGAGDVDSLWAAEAERRLEQAERGEVELYPAEDVLAEARSRLRR